MDASVNEKLDAILARLDEIIDLLNEDLDRPRTTIMHLSALSRSVVNNWIRRIFYFWQKLKREEPRQ